MSTEAGKLTGVSEALGAGNPSHETFTNLDEFMGIRAAASVQHQLFNMCHKKWKAPMDTHLGKE